MDSRGEREPRMIGSTTSITSGLVSQALRTGFPPDETITKVRFRIVQSDLSVPRTTSQ